MPLVILTEVTSNIVSHPDVDYTKLFPVSHFKGKTPLSGPSDGKIDDGPSPGTPSLLISHSVLSRDYNTSIKKFADDMEEHARFLLKKGSIRIDIVVGSAVREELVVKHIQDNFFRRAPARV